MQNPIVRTALGVLLGFVVLFVQSSVVMSIQMTAGPMAATPWLLPAIGHTTMVAVSLLLILALSKGRASTFGLRRPDSFPLVALALWSVGISGVSAAIEALVPGKGMTFIESYSFVQVVVFIWVWASICEEVFVRGLIQGFLAPLKSRGIKVAGVHISLPVIVGALFFGAMHLALLTMGVAALKVLVIVVFATAIGAVAGYYREKTDSIVPAIAVHAFANMAGSLVGLLVT